MRITLVTTIAAPVERCFDLARDIDLHLRSLRHTGERAVAGIRSGLIGLNQEVTWEATHLGVRQRLTSRITAFQAPCYFQDSMVAGAFAYYVHDHHFERGYRGTLMRDVVNFGSPLGPLGTLADRLLLSRYLGRMLQRRGEAIKEAAERGQQAST